MVQVSKRRLRKEDLETIRKLFKQMIGLLGNNEDDLQFLELFLTPTELTVLSKRFSALFLIHQKVPIRLVADYLKLSTSTVSQVSILYAMHKEEIERKMDKILKKREFKETLEDMVGIFLGNGPLPPYSGNWGEWIKRREQKKRKRSKPLRI